MEVLFLKIYEKLGDQSVAIFDLENSDCLASNVSINNIPSTFVSLNDEGSSIKTSNIKVDEKDYNEELVEFIIEKVDHYFFDE